MRVRLRVLSTILVSILSASCPGTEDVTPLPEMAPAKEPPRPVVAAAAVQVPAPTAVPETPHVPEPVPPELLDDGSEDTPAPAPLPRAKERYELASTARETWIHAAPDASSRRIGYLRAGAIVQRAAHPSTRPKTCPEGFYRIEPKGFVCVGDAATLNVFDPVVEASSKRPLRDQIPYTYVMSRFPPPPLYARLPERDDLQRTEPDLARHLRIAAHAAREPGYVAPPPPDPIPGALLYGRPTPALGSDHRSASTLKLGQARARSGFGLLSTFDHDGRRYGLTTELAVIPLDRTRFIQPSTFAGLELRSEIQLPVAFVKRHYATRYVEGRSGLTRGARLGFREAVPISSSTRSYGGVAYLAARDGSFLRKDEVVVVERAQHLPGWATPGRKWIDISILKQSLVAYEGDKPVFTTLVSTGIDGIGDPKETHSTIQGAFLIHTKHVSVTMGGDTSGEEFDFRDVPFVQYFTEGYALHAAYWHDEFGTPHSHGCINLSPRDAAFLFGWTTPEVPDTWHGALSLKKGTLVYTHP